MPEVVYSTVVRAPQEAIWDFVSNMDNWAPFVTGYQSHEIVDDTDSVWTLKGNVGVLARVVQFRVHITEWERSRVAFVMTGINEQTEAEGLFLMGPLDEVPVAPLVPPRDRGWRAVRARLLLFLYRRSNPRPVERSSIANGAASSQLTFRLRMKSGGVVGPVVDAMIEPMLAPAAEDLANRIANEVDQIARGGATSTQ